MGTVGTARQCCGTRRHNRVQPVRRRTGGTDQTTTGGMPSPANHDRVSTYRRTNARALAHATAVTMYRCALYRQSGWRVRVGVLIDSRARRQPRLAGERASIGRRSGFRALRAGRVEGTCCLCAGKGRAAPLSCGLSAAPPAHAVRSRSARAQKSSAHAVGKGRSQAPRQRHSYSSAYGATSRKS